jgi:hypothetical protein
MSLNDLIIKIRGLFHAHLADSKEDATMADKHRAVIDKPVQHTTSKGGSYITPFDLVRSKRGRDLVDRHARMAPKPSEPKVLKPAKAG